MRMPVGWFTPLALVLGSALAQAHQQIPHGQDGASRPRARRKRPSKTMTVPPGFTVELVASEPDIVNPVAMTFDERGRIWITESLEYPRQLRRPGPRSRQGPGRHRRRRQGRQVHGLRRGAEHPLGHRRRPRRRLGRQRARHPLLCRIPTATARRRQARSGRHRLRPGRHPRAAQLAHLGSRRLALRAQRRLQPSQVVNQQRQDLRLHLRPVPHPPARPASSSSSARGRATPGASPGTTKAAPSSAPA